MNEVSATFSIWSEKLEPQRITEILCFQPDNTAIKGADRDPPRPRPPAHGWHVGCREKDKELAGEVMGHLLERISPVLAKLPELRKSDPKISISFSLDISPKTTNVSLFFDRRTIETISSVEGDLDIEFFD